MSRPIIERTPGAAESLSELDPVLRRVFSARGVTEHYQLNYGLEHLLPIGTLENVAEGAELLRKHQNGRVVIVGDFDVDGATSTALMLRSLRAFGFENVDYLVPNRFDFGYGLSPEIVDVALQNKPDLIVTVDNGISSIEGVRHARQAGIDVLITDHHLPGHELPDANVTVNPNLAGSQFASRNLAGVGVAFYLLAALGRQLEQNGRKGAAKVVAGFLDLVALGTVADVVPLDHNNRVLVTQGLKRIRSGKTLPGIRALISVAGRNAARISSTDLGFALGPRLNAAGRLEDMGIGIECLLTDSESTALEHAEVLNRINLARRDIEQDMRDQAYRIVEAMNLGRLPNCVCLFDPGWHQGVVGLVAGRIKERFHRPVVAFAKDNDGNLKGSMRSVAGVHARDLLDAVQTQAGSGVIKFGGHAMAAGLTLEAHAFEAFSSAAQKATKRLYPNADFSGSILSDGMLPSAAMSLRFARELRDFGPWGSGFPEPCFHGDFRVLEKRTVGENHLKMRVEPADGHGQIDAIAFNQVDAACRGVVRLAYRLDVNEYRGVERPQLIVEQITQQHASS